MLFFQVRTNLTKTWLCHQYWCCWWWRGQHQCDSSSGEKGPIKK